MSGGSAGTSAAQGMMPGPVTVTQAPAQQQQQMWQNLFGDIGSQQNLGYFPGAGQTDLLFPGTAAVNAMTSVAMPQFAQMLQFMQPGVDPKTGQMSTQYGVSPDINQMLMYGANAPLNYAPWYTPPPQQPISAPSPPSPPAAPPGPTGLPPELLQATMQQGSSLFGGQPLFDPGYWNWPGTTAAMGQQGQPGAPAVPNMLMQSDPTTAATLMGGPSVAQQQWMQSLTPAQQTTFEEMPGQFNPNLFTQGFGGAPGVPAFGAPPQAGAAPGAAGGPGGAMSGANIGGVGGGGWSALGQGAAPGAGGIPGATGAYGAGMPAYNAAGTGIARPEAAAFQSFAPGLAGAGLNMIPQSQALAATLLGQIGIGGPGATVQSQLHDRYLQQMTDATRASYAARGMADTPYGAAGEAQAVGQFQQDWSDREFQRALQGIPAAFSIMQQGDQGAAAMMRDLQAGALGATATSQQDIGNWLSYAGAANAANATAVQNYAAQVQAALGMGQLAQSGSAQQGASLGGLGQGLGSIVGMGLGKG